ncbi:unnamed protein product, partial [Urochloa humidicola]
PRPADARATAPSTASLPAPSPPFYPATPLNAAPGTRQHVRLSPTRLDLDGVRERLRWRPQEAATDGVGGDAVEGPGRRLRGGRARELRRQRCRSPFVCADLAPRDQNAMVTAGSVLRDRADGGSFLERPTGLGHERFFSRRGDSFLHQALCAIVSFSDAEKEQRQGDPRVPQLSPSGVGRHAMKTDEGRASVHPRKIRQDEEGRTI